MNRPTRHLPTLSLRIGFWLGALLFAIAGAARAQPIVFSNFNSTSGLTLTSSTTATTTADGKVLRLVSATSTDVGAAFGTTQLNLANGFSTAFDFRLTNRGGITDGVSTGADGFVFVIQRVGAGAIGSGGGDLGFSGIGTNSFGVEFDTFFNSGLDPATASGGSNHIGIDTRGSVASLVTAAVNPDFDSGSKWTAWVDYNGSTVEVRVSNTGARPTSPNLSFSVNLANLLGGNTAFVGFTAGTGGAYANHDVLAWTYSDAFVAGGVTAGLAIPEPSTYALLALGLGALVIGGRRIRRGR